MTVSCGQRYHHALMDAARDTSDGGPPTRPHRGAILVLPTTLAGERGPVAAGVSTAGWAGGFRRALGEAWIVTPAGVVDPDELRRRASDANLAPAAGAAWRQRIPVVAKTVSLAGDPTGEVQLLSRKSCTVVPESAEPRIFGVVLVPGEIGSVPLGMELGPVKRTAKCAGRSSCALR